MLSAHAHNLAEYVSKGRQYAHVIISVQIDALQDADAGMQGMSTKLPCIEMSMSITNSAFLLATVAMPIDSAYSMHNASTLCFLLMRTTSLHEMVKIIE